jgi:hypothetical protein
VGKRGKGWGGDLFHFFNPSPFPILNSYTFPTPNLLPFSQRGKGWGGEKGERLRVDKKGKVKGEKKG